jgi:TonB-linked SusC/RagA family outer membrane protein
MMGFSFRRMVVTGVGALVVSAAAAAPVLAQNAVIRGTVTSNDRKEAIAGVNVVVAELNISVLSSDRGTYVLTVPAARIPTTPVTITARAIGFKALSRTMTLRAGEQTADFTLSTDINRLEEVIVTGSLEGVERAKVPYAVGRLTTEDLPVPSMDPIRALQGKVAGLRIGNVGGRPGSAPEILIRGPTSINATGRSQEPLIIVDGVILHVGSYQELGGLDIETVEVVKGAAGASLYGTQAANGVITITTKRGSTGADGIKFNARTEWGFSDFSSLKYGIPVNHQVQLDETGKRFCISVLSGNSQCARSMDLMTEMYRINNVNADTIRTGNPPLYGSMTLADLRNVYQAQVYPGRYFDGLAQISARHPTSLTAIDATGKVAGVSFYVSGEYTADPGAVKFMKGSDQRRGRLNLDYNPRSDLRISVSTMYDNFYRDNRLTGIFGTLLRGGLPGQDYLARDTIGCAHEVITSQGGSPGGCGRLLVARSNWRPTDNGGAFVLYDGENRVQDQSSNRFLGGVSVKYFPASWVTFEGVFGYDNRANRTQSIAPKGYRTSGISTSFNNGNLSITNSRDEALNAGVSATFRKKLASDLNGKIRFAGNFDQEIFQTNNGSGQIFNVKDIFTLSNLTANQAITSSSQTIKNMGLSGAATLDYKDRYILDGSYRTDGSSLFGPGHRWSDFSRLAGVWIVSHEPFWKVPFMEEFRLRASRGTAGTTPRFDAQYETFTVAVTGISTGRAGNSGLRPETTAEYEVGTDFTLFKRLGFELTYAQGTTKDQILLVNVPASVGYSSQWQNAGSLQNKTMEAAVTIPIVNSKSFYWQARGSWDRTRTYIKSLNVPDFIFDGGSAQGTGTQFYFTADSRKACLPGEVGHLPGEPGFAPGEARPNCTGPQLNRYGNFYGRWFFKSCNELAASLRSNCGPGKDFQVNESGWLVWVGAGNTPADGITKNLWQTTLRAADSPWGVDLAWGHPIVDRPLKGQSGEGVGINTVQGNSLPDFRFSFSNDFQYKRVTLYTLVDATVGQLVNNQGEQWGLLSLGSAAFDQKGKSVETAKPISYSWRAGSPESTGLGGFYDTLNPNNNVLEKGTFAKLREISLTYKLGRIGGYGDWTLGVTGRNLFTLTGYSGYDPETGCGSESTGCGGGGSSTQGTGSGLINGTDAFSFPSLRTFTFTVSTRF